MSDLAESEVRAVRKEVDCARRERLQLQGVLARLEAEAIDLEDRLGLLTAREKELGTKLSERVEKIGELTTRASAQRRG